MTRIGLWLHKISLALRITDVTTPILTWVFSIANLWEVEGLNTSGIGQENARRVQGASRPLI